MKKTLVACLLFLSAASFSQTTIFPQDQNKKHEVSLNALTLLATNWFDVSYDYLLNEESSLGIDIHVSLSSPDERDLAGYRKFSITPNYRRFFSEKYARGFYVEAFGMFHVYDEYDFDFYNNNNNQLESNTDFSLGISIGGKWVTKRGFITDIFVGFGRNLINPNDNSSEAAGRIGISLGYRF